MAKFSPQLHSQAGILGVSSNTSFGGLKVEPKLVLVVSVLIILIIKVLGKILEKSLS
jgi:preprotein translocase subunit Sec61beta